MITRETVLAAFEKRLADDPLVSAEWHAFARADLAATLAKSGRAPDDNRPLSTGGKCPASPGHHGTGTSHPPGNRPLHL